MQGIPGLIQEVLMARNFLGKILKFANHLAADYYTRDQSKNTVEKSGKKKSKVETNRPA